MTIDWSQLRLSQEVDAARMNEARAAAKTALAAHVEALLQQGGDGVPLMERLGWASKEVAARAFVARVADEEQITLIQAEAQTSGDNSDDLAHSILRQAAAQSAAVARLTGGRRRVVRLIESAGSVAEVGAVLAKGLAGLTLDSLASDKG